ncbi:MAG: hypothetical protein AB7S38_14370 [Vulcanimicrobiota bacterium]
MELEPNVENLTDAFGFRVPDAFVTLVKAALEQNPRAPHLAFALLGLELGGPLFPFLGGSPVSLREPQMPPEFFPFALRSGREPHYYGFVVDDPDRYQGEELFVGRLAIEDCESCGVVSETLQGFFARLTEESGSRCEWLDQLGWGQPAQDLEELQTRRRSQSAYWTADQLGLVVPEEPAPLSLMHHEFRRLLIENRDYDKIRNAGRGAVKVGAPGAALALARDLNWWLGERNHWFQLALELYEEAYSMLERPLLTRVARREWARHYGRRGRA